MRVSSVLAGKERRRDEKAATVPQRGWDFQGKVNQKGVFIREKKRKDAKPEG